MPATVVKLGPGTLTVGATGTPVDFSCQITAAQVEWNVSADDPVTVLCGDSVPGARTYDAHLTGTLFQDLGLVGGIVEYSWAHKGETVPFEFVPATDVATSVTGDLIIDPISVGGDTAGDNMTSDIDWTIVGEPVLGPASVVGAGRHSPASEPVGA
jgi:hypothetical protein